MHDKAVKVIEEKGRRRRGGGRGGIAGGGEGLPEERLINLLSSRHDYSFVFVFKLLFPCVVLN